MTDRGLLIYVLDEVHRMFDVLLDKLDNGSVEFRQRRQENSVFHGKVMAAIRFTNVDGGEMIGRYEVNLDAVADDLAANRADTESHAVCRVKKSGS